MKPDPATNDATSRIVISGHQVDVGDTLRAHATEQLDALGHKYFDRAEDATCTFSRTGSGGFGCAIRLHSGRGLFFEGTAEHAAAPGAFALALEHVAKQLRRRKRELREDKPVNPTRDGVL
ncbi:HPF/RaiA family ribosome-associated protein [Dankookia sp. GCM10030260]|uniref:HPF/RaiA family ribosome-associated protein n=1 Tax=Dankookia sp. GCM10030260 TaxID=3273390 RepID=UPI003624161D